jgi:hypothetical protein
MQQRLDIDYHRPGHHPTRHRAIPVHCLALGLACRESWYRYQNDLPDKNYLNLKQNNDVGWTTKIYQEFPISYSVNEEELGYPLPFLSVF